MWFLGIPLLTSLESEENMKDRMTKAVLRFSWGLNFAMLGCVFVAAILVDGNGRLLGMSQTYSMLLALMLFALGIISALAVLIFWPKPRGKIVGGLSLGIYLVLAIPAVL